jgi:hypothetical protein
MKKLIPFLVLLAGATVAMAQGTVNFANSVAFATTADRLVRNPDGTPATGSLTTDPATLVAQLWYGASAGSLQAHTAAPARFRPGSTGLWLGGVRTLTGFAPGTTLTLEVRAWDTRTGATWDVAGVRGQSQSFTYTIPLDPLSPPAAYFMEGMRGFTLVPEPSVIGLGLIGVGALFMLRRRK